MYRSIAKKKMKRLVFNVLAGVFIAAALTACGGGSGSSGGGSGGGKSAKITMTTEEGDDFSIELCGSGVATVDWGDGSEKTSLTLIEDCNYWTAQFGVRFKHIYSSATTRTITVNGDNITGLHCLYITSLDVSKNAEMTQLHCGVSQQLTSLDVNKNTSLTYLYVSGNLTSFDVSKNTSLTHLFVSGNLTSFDVSKNTALTKLYVRENQLTAAALNALFGTLHSNPGEKTIYIHSNPGTADCDRSIAEHKGWTVE